MEQRICQCCGKPMKEGMTDLFDFYAHSGKCFETEMDKLYGKGNWFVVEDDGEGGYYMYREDGNREPQGTGIFYTDWYDET